MPGIDKPTGRVVALIVLLIAAAAALRGYLPAQVRGPLADAGGNRAAMMFVIAALAGTLALMTVAVIARLRDPRAAAPTAFDVSDMIGGGKGRPSWRVLLIGLAVIVAWLLIAMMLAHLFVPHEVSPAPPSKPLQPATPPPAHDTVPPPKHNRQNDPGDMVGVLLASAVPLLLIIVASAVINTRRRWLGRFGPAPGISADDYAESGAPTKHSELVRAAEVGLAEMADLSREPREAIIACYAAMERELANVPGAVPQDFDTPTEVLARAVEHHALHADNAVQLVNLFEEARFSPHVMNEGHREVAVRVLQLVLDELAASSV
ncbi:DUF4129 domain-containing protein [Mycobacterium sp.]|uniref:DUF4129 domain-containing protein n=1 Tax=Mycobacterium sp. TaxID=1785 RepID=UPI003F96C788